MRPVVIRCGRCLAERQQQPGRVGEVVLFNRRLLWHGFDAPSAQALRNFDGTGAPPVARHSWTILEDPADPGLEAPATLSVWCRRHGPGAVAVADVVARARGSMPPAPR